MSGDVKTLNIDSTALYLTAYSTHFSQSPFISNPLPPIPSTLPHLKLIPGTRFIVDGFKQAGEFSVSYFLSHFHSDHYTGLSPSWSKGLVYCSPITARLLIEVLKVPAHFVVELPLSERVVIDACEVFLVGANHCPGAVQFLFKVPGGDGAVEKYVHTGDFRYCDSMKSMSPLKDFIGADAVFLDTTYCNPKFVFPTKEESIDYIVSVIDRIGAENDGKLQNVLFLIATYVIGKEKILVEVSKRCNRKIHVNDNKMAVLKVLGLGEDGVFTVDESQSDVHVVGWNVLGKTWPYFQPNFIKMKEIMEERGYTKVVGFVPTGWTYEVKKNKFAVKVEDSFEIHLVPYSEHSNYDELREYVKFLKPKRVIPTVGMDIDKLDSKQANAMQKHFAALLDATAVKQEFLKVFHCGTRETGDKCESRGVVVKDEGCCILGSNFSMCKQNGNDVMAKERSEDVDIENPSLLQRDTALGDSEAVNQGHVEGYNQELTGCLPSWVTENQMLHLFKKFGGDIVEAVSYFYEYETEFHEQITNSTAASCKPISSKQDKQFESALPLKITEDDSAFPSITAGNKHELPSLHCLGKGLPESKNHSLNQLSRPPISLNRNKTGASPGKRKKVTKNKTNKKTKGNNSQQPSGSKQHTITKFFNKLAPLVSPDNETCAASRHLHNDDPLLSNDNSERYKSEVDQFIQTVHGSESLRSQAAVLLEKTKGDMNAALDIYYSNSSNSLNGKRESMPKTGVIHTQFTARISSPDKCDAETRRSETLACVTVQPVIEFPDYVPLPPEKYRPVEHACWKVGQAAPYLHLARAFALVEEERGRSKVASMLCNMFRSLLALSPEDVLPAVYLCTNKISPEHENMELNIGGSIVIEALKEACWTKKSRIWDLYKERGDLGDAAQLCRQTQVLLVPPAPLTIRGVYSDLREICVQTGSGSTTRKKQLIVNLMRSCRDKEIKFLVRTLVRNLRIGATMRTVLPALAQAVVINLIEGSAESLKEHLQRISAEVIEVYNMLPNLDLLVPSLVEKGVTFSSTSISMVPGIPIKPMLAKITNGSSQALVLFQNKAFTCEYKYDGQRAQIHKLDGGFVRVYSRKGDETTARFPDLVNIITEACGSSAETFILDAEVVAIDRKEGLKLKSFQDLSSRERGSKGSFVAADKIKVEICIFIFDIMFVNGQQLLNLPLRERRKHMKDVLGPEKPGYFEYTKEITVESEDASPDNETTLTRMNSFFNSAVHSACEGIMVKCLDINAGYTPSRRSDSWLKVKKDYVEGLGHSLDLVPIGAWHGNGRKKEWYSPFLMACYNPETQQFQSVCRVMSGFSDSFYAEMKSFLDDDKILPSKPPYYETAETPEFWFSPDLVWEIKGADFTISPVHHAAVGLVHPSRGISVRFPRFSRSVPDRDPEECTTCFDIAEMFHSQTNKKVVQKED